MTCHSDVVQTHHMTKTVISKYCGLTSVINVTCSFHNCHRSWNSLSPRNCVHIHYLVYVNDNKHWWISVSAFFYASKNSLTHHNFRVRHLRQIFAWLFSTLLTTPREARGQLSVFKSITSSNSKFSFFFVRCCTKSTEPNLPYCLFIIEKRDRFMPFR